MRFLFYCIKEGALLGLLLGHIDLLVRVSYLSFQWFEIYQALLIPSLIFALLFGGVALVCLLTGVCTEVTSQLKERFALVHLQALTALVIWVAIQLLYYGDLKSLVLYPDNAANIFLGFLLIATFFSIIIRGLFAKICRSKFAATFAVVFSQYVFLVSVFVITLFAYDFYQLRAVPSHAPLSPNAQGKPNIVFVTLDTLRADHLGAYGYPHPTSPHLDELAAKSVLFTNATSSAPWTLPSHATMFTGKYPFEHGATLNHQKLLTENVTLAELLRDQGYVTAGITSGPYTKAKYGFAQGFMYYRDRLDFWENSHLQDWVSIIRLVGFFSRSFSDWLLGANGEVSAPEVNEVAFEWLDKNSQHPFFLFLNYFDVHDPYDSGYEFLDLFTSEKREYKPIQDLLYAYCKHDPTKFYTQLSVPDSTRAYIEALYDAEIRYLDGQFRKLIDKLESLKLLENTIVIITSDHGEEFFEHGGCLHLNTLYEELVHIPLMFYAPGRLSPARVTDRVGAIDFFSTILELTNTPYDRTPHSRSFTSLLKGQDLPERDPVISERYIRSADLDSQQTSATSQSWKYMQVDPERERIQNSLYNLKQDPKESDNRIQKNPEKLHELQSFLEKSLNSKFQ